jgi:hypothetical protein
LIPIFQGKVFVGADTNRVLLTTNPCQNLYQPGKAMLRVGMAEHTAVLLVESMAKLEHNGGDGIFVEMRAGKHFSQEKELGTWDGRPSSKTWIKLSPPSPFLEIDSASSMGWSLALQLT